MEKQHRPSVGAWRLVIEAGQRPHIEYDDGRIEPLSAEQAQRLIRPLLDQLDREMRD